MAKVLRHSFTKSNLIQKVSDKYADLSRDQAKHIVNCIFNAVKRALAEKKRVEIRGFGSFGLKSYSARSGKNPKTGEVIQVESKTLPFFRVGKLKETIKLDKV